MGRTWITSDPHFGHGQDKGEPVRGIIKHCSRPFSCRQEMDEFILHQWNNTVAPDDRLYILGDFMFGPREDRPYSGMVTQYRTRISCQEIHLIMGNHDKRQKNVRTLSRSGKEYVEWVPLDVYYDVFDSVQEVLEIEVGGRMYFLSHYPGLSWNKSHHNARNLYGHHHGNLDRQWKEGIHGHSPSVLAMDVGVDCRSTVKDDSFKPWSFEQIEAIMAKKTPDRADASRKPGHSYNPRTSLAPGYCQLCREKEIGLYGMLTDDYDKHRAACKAAGCEHPAYYG